MSSIPRGETHASGHWAYPSEASFFRALRNKGASPSTADMPAVLAIHNAVNEQTWQRILAAERSVVGAANVAGVRLLRFYGNQGAVSPRMAYNVVVRGTVAPFDRHDWYVQRPCGTVVRYVIDYYVGASPQSRKELDASTPAVHIDARIAVDSLGTLCDRVRQWFHSRS